MRLRLPKVIRRRLEIVDVRWLAVAGIGIAMVGASVALAAAAFLIDLRDRVTHDHVTVERISKSPCANLKTQTCLEKLIRDATPQQIAALRGARGPRGRKGDRGPRGPRGFQGLPGPGGAVGPSGSAGQRGSGGRNGTNGSKGTPGAPGVPGTPGVPSVPGVPTPGCALNLPICP